LFQIDTREVLFSRRGFTAAAPEAQCRLEKVGGQFLEGYHAALGETHPDRLAELLNGFDAEVRGFAFEGAAMALALLDCVVPLGTGRWERFLESSGTAHCYMLHVGYGWVVARLPWLRRNPTRRLSRFDPLLRWLVLEGFGFHEGYFHWQRELKSPAPARRLAGYARRAFDQGLGRSLWFVGGADVGRVTELVQQLDSGRRPDLWSGVGLACAYAGAIPYEQIARLAEATGDHCLELAQGAAFAAKARQRAGNMASHTERACQVLCGMDAASAAAVTDVALENLASDEPDRPAYEVWRTRIQSRLAQTVSLCPT
jgi:hypothetical protein